MIKMFVGLGNPGDQYQKNRHNAGFWWIDALARTLHVSLNFEHRYHCFLKRVNIAGHSILMLQPQTFMNLSGKSVLALARFFKINAEEILVAHDDMDFSPGLVRLKYGGSHGGHNGLRDIAMQLGSNQYWRIRLGIGHPGHKDAVIGWVLGNPSHDQRQDIDTAIDHSLKGLNELLEGNMDKAMRLINARTN